MQFTLSSSNDSPFWLLRPVTSTLEPWVESFFATAPPIPEVPPVTSAIFPDKSFWDKSSLKFILCLWNPVLSKEKTTVLSKIKFQYLSS